METRCTCAEARAAQSAAHIDRLNIRVDALRRQWREQMDISDTARVQVGELRRLLDQERDSRLSLLVTISEGIAREDAMRELLCEAQATIKRLDDGLAQACVANDSLVSQLRDRDRQIAELRSRLIENAEHARADRIGWGWTA
jgi:hypothetical protein